MNTIDKEDKKKLIVVKAGGSLIDVLPEIIAVLKESEREILIVPGGGLFADCVRDIDPEPDTAHWMAILGMEQYGFYISSLGVKTTQSPEYKDLPGRVSVLLPYKVMRECDPLPHSWDVTSDSIAAWVADRLSADLLLLKSVDGLNSGGKIVEEVCAELRFEEVDSFLIPFVLEKNIDTRVLNARKPDRIRDFLLGRDFVGTRIHRKFLSGNTPNL
ncbi:MAG: uridylate kinase [Methanomicrobiaceae archaeon]|nr:uridylate kinase [Methanomicrobiaceae archaeon]